MNNDELKSRKKKAKENRIDVVWSKDRDKIFMERLTRDINNLRQAGFSSEDINEMINNLSYIHFWKAWPQWAWPVDKLPEGYKWKDGKEYAMPNSGKKSYKRGIFLEIGDDLYFRWKRKDFSDGYIGINIYDDCFIKIINFRKLSLADIRQTQFYNDLFEKYWAENGGKITNNPSILFRGDNLKEEWNDRKKARGY